MQGAFVGICIAFLAMGFLSFRGFLNILGGRSMNSTTQTSGILTRAQAAEYLSLSKGTLDKLDIPKIQVRRRILYKRADIDAWLEGQKTGRATA